MSVMSNAFLSWKDHAYFKLEIFDCFLKLDRLYIFEVPGSLRSSNASLYWENNVKYELLNFRFTAT